MNKARYVKSRWWVAASAVGAFAAMFGALFAHDRDAFDATRDLEAAAPVATAVPLAPARTQSTLPGTRTQPSARQVQPSAPSTTTTQPHTRTRAS